MWCQTPKQKFMGTSHVVSKWYPSQGRPNIGVFTSSEWHETSAIVGAFFAYTCLPVWITNTKGCSGFWSCIELTSWMHFTYCFSSSCQVPIEGEFIEFMNIVFCVFWEPCHDIYIYMIWFMFIECMMMVFESKSTVGARGKNQQFGSVPSLKVLHTDQVSSTTLARLSRDAATIRLHLGHNWIELTILGVFGLLTLVATFLSFFYVFDHVPIAFLGPACFQALFWWDLFVTGTSLFPRCPANLECIVYSSSFIGFVHGHSVTSTLGSCQCGIPLMYMWPQWVQSTGILVTCTHMRNSFARFFRQGGLLRLSQTHTAQMCFFAARAGVWLVFDGEITHWWGLAGSILASPNCVFGNKMISFLGKFLIFVTGSLEGRKEG